MSRALVAKTPVPDRPTHEGATNDELLQWCVDTHGALLSCNRSKDAIKEDGK